MGTVPTESKVKEPRWSVGASTTDQPGRDATSRSAMDSLKWRAVKASTPSGQVGAVRLERAHREDHHGARPVERVELRRGQLLQTVDGQKLLPRVAAR